jgi:hypothetical protein
MSTRNEEERFTSEVGTPGTWTERIDIEPADDGDAGHFSGTYMVP